MDVQRTTQSAWLHSLAMSAFALVISLGEVSRATAEEATVSDSEASSTIFISDDTDSAPPSLPQTKPTQSVEGSVVFVEDTPAANSAPTPVIVQRATLTQIPTLNQPPKQQPKQPVVRGDLKVVSNQQSSAALQPLRPLPIQAPVMPPSAQPATTIKPTIKPLPTIQQVAAIEPVAAPAVRDQPGDIQIAIHAEPVVTQTVVPKTEAASLAELLVTAHRLSLQAQTAADYSRIAQATAEAIRLGAKGDQRYFAKKLSSWSLNRRGQMRAEGGEQDLANADFQAALDFNPKNWRALHNRGVSFAQAGQFAEAFDDFNAVIQLNPKYAKAYANRATLYVQAKDMQSAIKDYELAIQFDTEFATAHVGLGRVCHMLGRWEDAVEHFSSAIQLEPASADIVCSRGDLHADMGQYGEALADYARTIELDTEFAHAYRNGAWLLATCPDERYRDPENAILGAQQALEYSYGDRHVALDTLAAALASNGQFEEAITTVTQAVDMAPEDAKFTYLSRLQLYQDNQPFRTEPVGDVSQATYEASDK